MLSGNVPFARFFGLIASSIGRNGIAIDSNGNLYVADYMNHTIRKVTADGVVTTLAGSAGNSGFVDGQGTTARFMSVQGIAVDSSGNVYVADSGNRSIRKITPSGLVSTFVNGSSGSFGQVRGLAIDSAGIVYATDYSANVIYRITAAGVVTTIAGTAPTPGSTDATGSAALFNAPSAVAIDSAGNLYIADRGNHTIRKGTLLSTTPVSFSAGWNLAGNGAGAAIDVASKFNDTGAVTTVWKWDAGSANWLFYTPLMDAAALQTYAASKGYGVLATLNPGDGYWVNAKTALTLGAQSVASYALSSSGLARGWNLVATGSDITLNR